MQFLFKDDYLVDDNVIEANKKYVSHYLYPAASLAYAYEPIVGISQTLNEKFKQHNWFLPAPGDAARIAYYMQHAIDKNLTSIHKDAKSFEYPCDKFTTLKSGWGSSNTIMLTTCAQYDGTNCVCIKANGKYNGANYETPGLAINSRKDKVNFVIVRPICAF
jgi:hypothetical protein